jgi:hypothetical protein
MVIPGLLVLGDQPAERPGVVAATMVIRIGSQIE